MEEVPYPACHLDIVTIDPQDFPDETIVGGSGDYSYVWPGEAPCLGCSYDFIFDLNNGGEIQYVPVTIIDNCSDSGIEFPEKIRITNIQPNAPQILFNPIGEQFCPGDEIEIEVQAVGPSQYDYQWQDCGDGNAIGNAAGNPFVECDDIDFSETDNGTIVTVSPNDTTTYQVVVTDKCNLATFMNTITVETPAYDPPTFVMEDIEGCVGDVVELSVDSLTADGVQTDSDYTYLWSDGSTSSTIQVVIEEDPVEYFVTVADLCGNEGQGGINGDVSSTNVYASIPQSPDFDFEQFTDTLKFIQLIPNADSLYLGGFEWDFGDGNISDEYEPTHIYGDPGDYEIVLKAWDHLGCLAEYNRRVNIYYSLFFYAPTIFSPNNNGTNDTFKVSVVGQEEFELFIYDRWGKQLFYSTDPNEGWDGKYSNGEDVPQDIYMYKAYMSNESTGKQLRKGKLSIIK